jgi:hypothetical protein
MTANLQMASYADKIERMKPAITLLILAVAFPALAQEPYKCKTAAGFVYQDSPCKAQAPEKRPSGTTPAVAANQPPPPISAAAPQSETQARMERDKDYLAEGAKARRRSDIKYEIDRLEESISASQQAMSADITALEIQKTTARNNLAGAVYLQSLSAEMQAVTSRHGIDISTKQDRVKKLREDLAQIK